MNSLNGIVPKGIDVRNPDTWECPSHWPSDTREFEGWKFKPLREASKSLSESPYGFSSQLFINDEEPGPIFLHVFRADQKVGEIYINSSSSDPSNNECYSPNEDAICYSVFTGKGVDAFFSLSIEAVSDFLLKAPPWTALE